MGHEPLLAQHEHPHGGIRTYLLVYAALLLLTLTTVLIASNLHLGAWEVPVARPPWLVPVPHRIRPAPQRRLPGPPSPTRPATPSYLQ